MEGSAGDCRAVHDDVASRDRCFVLVLLDLHMPNLDGCSAARNLRQAGSTAPLVAVTGDALPRADPHWRDDDDAVALQFDDVITKPLNQGHADALVRKWVLPRLHRKRSRSNGALPSPPDDDAAPPRDDDAAARRSGGGGAPLPRRTTSATRSHKKRRNDAPAMA